MTVKKKGWWASAMSQWDDAKKREVLEQYGQEGLTENTYNWLRARVKDNSADLEREKLQDIQAQKDLAIKLGGKPTTLVVNPTQSDINKYLYNPEEGKEDGGTYFGGWLGQAEAVGEKKEATKETATAFLNEYQNDPTMLFNPRYAKTRAQISDAQWIKLITAHPEYWNSVTSKMIPDSAQSKLFNRGIRQATDAAAQHVVQALLAATNPLAGIAGLAGAKLTDEVVNKVSDGKYQGWSDMIDTQMKENGIESELARNVVSTFTNPGAWALGAAGGFATPTYTFSGIDPIGILKSKLHVEAGTPLVENAADGVMTLELPTLSKVAGTRKVTQDTPTNTGGGLGKGQGRVGGGGKGLNPRGQLTLETITVPEQVRGTISKDIPINVPYELFPVEFTKTQHVTVPTPTLTPEGKPTYWIPKVDFYQTGYDWGDPEFQAWWQQNYPGNEGKILDYKGKKIKMDLDPNGYRRINIHTGYKAGNYPQGSITGNTVIGERHITVPELRIPAGAVALSPVQLVPNRELTLGKTVTLKRGGTLNYLNFFK